MAKQIFWTLIVLFVYGVISFGIRQTDWYKEYDAKNQIEAQKNVRKFYKQIGM